MTEIHGAEKAREVYFHRYGYYPEDRPTDDFSMRGRQERLLWSKAVIARDDYTCQDCGKRGGKLHAVFGTAGDLVAPMVTDALITHADAARADDQRVRGQQTPLSLDADVVEQHVPRVAQELVVGHGAIVVSRDGRRGERPRRLRRRHQLRHRRGQWHRQGVRAACGP